MSIEVKVPDGVSGDWSVETFTVPENDISQMISRIKTGRYVPAGTYKRLVNCGICVMSNTANEIGDFRRFVAAAHGKILVNGLGLGVLLQALLNKPEVTEITVIEISKDVINLVAETYLADKRVTIINADAYKWTPPKDAIYDCVWHDIWNDLCVSNLKLMNKLHRKYSKKTKYQESWGRSITLMYKRQQNKWR